MNMEKNNTKEPVFQLSNKNRSTNFFLFFIASGIIFSGAGFYLVAIEKMWFLIALIVVAIVYFVIFTRIRPSFVEFIFLDDRFTVNYYPVSSVTRDYQSVEIPFVIFNGYEIKQSLWGMKKTLTLTIVNEYGLADYPPVSISILTKNEIAQITYVFDKVKRITHLTIINH
jgi:hypothetical protein